MLTKSVRIVQIVVIVLTISMLFGACGAGVNSNTGTSSGTAANKAGVSQTEPQKEIALQMYGWTDGAYKIDEVINRFQNENPGITVSFSGVGTADFSTAQKTKLLSGDGSIDIIWEHPGSEFTTVANAGFLEDLTGSSWISNIQEGALDAVTYDGKIYGIPCLQNLLGVYYNKKIFADLGLNVPNTWSELIGVCDKLKANNIAPFALALGDWPKQFLIYGLYTSMIASKNKNWDKDRTAGKVSFSDFVPLFDKYVEIIQKYAAEGPKGALGVKYDTHLQLLVSGKAAMLFQGTWAINDLKKLDPNIDVGMFPLNGLDDPSGLVVPQGIGFDYCLISKISDEKKQAAKKFIEFISTPESCVEGDIPVIKGVSETPEFLKEYMMPVVDQGKSAGFMDVPWPAGFSDQFQNKIGDQIITMTAKPADILQSLDKLWDDAVQKAKGQ